MDGPSFPRSIRWRLQLGLLALPNDADDDNDNDCSMEDIYKYNASLLHDQRSRYHDLVDKYEVGLHAAAASVEAAVQEKEEAPAESKNNNHDSTAALDPLTAMVREQEAQAKRRQELELKYRKERARRNRGIYEGERDSPTNGGTDAVRTFRE